MENSSKHFGVFRIIFGIYLFIHFFQLIPYGTEIWSNEGVLPKANLNLTYPFPNILTYFDNPDEVQLILYLLCFCSIGLIIGFQRWFFALILWIGWFSLFNRNNLINNPGIPFVGLLLLFCIVIPTGEKYSLFIKEKSNWQMPKILFNGAWFIMSISYTISGIDKLNAPSWIDGNAVYYLLENPLARDWILRESFLNLPTIILKCLSWSILFIEISFMFFAFFKKTRFYIWLATIFMHIGILLLVDFADLTFGLLMIHLFTFDISWITKNPSRF